MNSIPERIRDVLNTHNLLPYGSSFAIGFSGGADSLVLLNSLNSLNKQYSYN